MPIFEKKKPVPVKELIGRAVRASTKIPGAGGKIYPRQELVKMLKELLPYQKIGSHLSPEEARVILRKLRNEEYRAQKTDQKLKLNRLRRILEQDWGLAGKY